MATSIFPVATSSTDTSFAATIVQMGRTYEHVQNFSTGIYTITLNPSSTNAGVVFASETAYITRVGTTSGTVSVQLNTAATRVYVTGAVGGTDGAIITIAKTAAILTPSDIGNGTLDTVNTTGTYNQTGRLAILAFGGGSAGEKAGIGYGTGGNGGASGGVAVGVVYTNSPTTITIGAGGVAATSNNTNIVPPTQTSFGNILTSSTTDFFFQSGAGPGSPGNYNGGDVGTASRSFLSFNGNSTTGGGGGGGNTRPNGNVQGGGQPGGGSGIGTGGTSGTRNGGNASNFNAIARGTAGIGKASGGGGGSTAPNNNPDAICRFGGDGAPGVAYILRGF